MAGTGSNTELTSEEKQVLVSYCLYMAKLNNELSVAHINAFTWAVSKKVAASQSSIKLPGPVWNGGMGFQNVIPKIREENLMGLIVGGRQWTTRLTDNFFALYKILLDDKSTNIFNADESGIDLNSKAGKVVVASTSKHIYCEQKSLRDHITTMVCCSAAGLTLLPMNIFEKSWPSGPFTKNGSDGCLCNKSSNG